MQTDAIFLEMYYRLRNFNAKYVKFPLKVIKSSEYRTILKKNQQFKNKYIGQRCFVLGNGPSIKEEQLTELKHEHVFVVNQCSRLDYVKEIQPEFYICIDDAFFNIDDSNEGDLELLNTFKQLKNISPKMECFFPIEQKERFIEKHGLDQVLNINYFQRGLSLYHNCKEFANYTGPVAGFSTVVHNAVSLALYMGFKEIYLLGCDNTGIVVTIKTSLNTVSDDEYAYHVTENEKKRMGRMIEGKFEDYCKAYYYTVRDYRLLYEYCVQHNVKLVNLSKETVIDSVPRGSLANILRKD